MDRDAVREAVAEALMGIGLHLDEITWRENFNKQTLYLSIKVSGELRVQEPLPFPAER